MPDTAIHWEHRIYPHLSACIILGRFRLGLPPGVTSLCLPPSNSFMSALFSAFGSTGLVLVALSLCATFSSFDFLSDFRFSVAGGGGVVERGGVSTLLGAMMAVVCRKRGGLSMYCLACQHRWGSQYPSTSFAKLYINPKYRPE